MSLLENVKAWFGAVESAPVERKVADLINRNIEEDRFPDRVKGDAFEPGLSYFGIRLSGLHLKDARHYAKKQLPLCVCLVEFQSAGQRRTVPFSIGPDVIQQKLKAAGVSGDEPNAKPAWIELIDITVIRPTPMDEDNVSLYTGLFSVPGDDLVKRLLNVVGSIGTALGQPQLGPGLRVAETIYDSFGSLLGQSSVQQVAAALIGSVLTDVGSGYLLIANVTPEAFDVSRARVVKGRLCWPADKHDGRPVVEFDHALLALEHFDTVVQKGTGMAPALFGAPWAAVRAATDRSTASAALRRLQENIAASPDLTETDRIALIGGYAKAAELLAQALWPLAADGAAIEPERAGDTRDRAKDGLSGRLRVSAKQYEPGDDSAPDRPKVVKSAIDIATIFDKLEQGDANVLQSDNSELSDALLDKLAFEAAIAIRGSMSKRPALDKFEATTVGRLISDATIL